jgi:ribosome-binding protein aMBF1 (putative translation factor)
VLSAVEARTLISRTRFVAAMERQAYSCAGLAREVGCSKSMIGHLRSGRTRRCSRQLADAIEYTLDAELFKPVEAQVP